MSYVFTPRYPFNCPGCSQHFPKGWEPGIGFDDDGTLMCVNCLNNNDGSDVYGTVTAKYGADHTNLAGVPTSAMGRQAPTCEICGLNHRGEC